MILPLKQNLERKNTHFFRIKSDASVETYWVEPITRSNNGLHQLDAGFASNILLAELEQYWLKEKKASLPKLVPLLEVLQNNFCQINSKAITEKGNSVSEFVYPLY
jgi:hypothetical protein